MTGPVTPPTPSALMPPQSQPNARPSFRTLAIAASGLSAQRARMDVIAMNVANAETTRTADGGPYRRRVVELEPLSTTEFRTALDAARDPIESGVAQVARIAQMSMASTISQASKQSPPEAEAFGVRVRAVTEDVSAGPRVYEPGHPDADNDGYVTYPNVRVTDELVDLMDARQMYEALTSVFLVTKSMLRRSTEI